MLIHPKIKGEAAGHRGTDRVNDHDVSRFDQAAGQTSNQVKGPSRCR